MREDFEPDSDLDVLAEFEEDSGIGWEFVSLQDELTDLLGRQVDLQTPQSLSRYFRDQVLQSAKVIYQREG